MSRRSPRSSRPSWPGLGIGSLAGGRLARGPNHTILLFCGLIEIAIGIFGVWSLGFFRWIGSLTLGLPAIPRGAAMALVVMLPTTLMGATLPLLVAFLVRSTGNVGRTVGLLYFVNTAGSAFAAIAAVLLILGDLGETRSVYLAASLNFLVGALPGHSSNHRDESLRPEKGHSGDLTIIEWLEQLSEGATADAQAQHRFVAAQ